jgi:3'-5' exonuclease
MIKSVQSHVWAFDCEWAPDPKAGRLLYGLPEDLSDLEVVGEMWKRGGATEEDPTPFLKTVQCRVVSIAAVQRRVRGSEVDLRLLWLPRQADDPAQHSEAAIIGTFLQALGKHRPQVVGFNSQGADLKILVQRGIIQGLSQPEFCRRPDKPWEGADYFARGSEANIDMMEILGGWGNRGVSLNEMATLSGIPGKFGIEGEDVAKMWLAGRWTEIIQYNCFDALTTYLLWLRLAHFAGHFNAEQYEEEQERVRHMIMDLAEQPGSEYLSHYLDEWVRLETATGQI